MNWLDISLIVFLVVVIAMGARLGSLWTAACMGGGFMGAWLVDYYSLPMSEMMGGFRGSPLLSTVLLYLAGIILILGPGLLLSRVFSGIIFGVIDGIFGVFTGAVAGILAISLGLLLLVPIFPQVEKSRAWRKSVLIKPFYQVLEEIFNSPHFRPTSPIRKLETSFQEVSPQAFDVKEKVLDWSNRLKDKLKK